MGLKRRLRVWGAVFRIRFAEGVQYRLAFFTGAAASIVWAVIEIAVFRVFFTYTEGGTLFARMSLAQVVSYAWLNQIFFALQPMSIEPAIQKQIENGDIGIELCRPLGLFGNWFFKNGASRLVQMVFRGLGVLAAGLCVPRAYRMGPPDSWPGFAWFLVSMGAAWLLCTAYANLICAVRLNIPWGNGPTYILMLAGGVLSGGYLPLQLWPDRLQRLLVLQPFAGYLDIPVRLYIGTMPPGEAWRYLTLQLLWAGAFLLLGRAVLAKQLKQIVVQGG